MANTTTTTTTTAEALWVAELNDFSARNGGRRMDLEVVGDVLGLQNEATDFILRGVAYDPRDKRIEIMMSGAEGAHLTHTVGQVASVDMLLTTFPSGDVLRIVHEGGQVMLHCSM